ncbi:MAG: hemolysin III family protein [Acidobacteria bacterium]|nr:hemolysin III family protein [Acidobacteriota bacterium]MCW5948874.1 hemolysin III family protein [Pyrinomonadaceae bacterium]
MTRGLRSHFSSLPVDEVANTLTHGFGLLLSLVGLAVLTAFSIIRGETAFTIGSIVYGTSLVILYAASTMYHGTSSATRKHFLQLVDHCCIYLLIAGSYTPFLVIVLRDNFSMALLASVWAIAGFGIFLKVCFRSRFNAAGIVTYVVMGWLGLIAITPLYNALGAIATGLVVAGGISYTAGLVFFGWRSLRHHHAIWHIFVLAGSILHFAAIAGFVVPFAFRTAL